MKDTVGKRESNVGFLKVQGDEDRTQHGSDSI